LPISGAPEQRCQLTATTYYLLKIFFRTTYFKEQLGFINQHKYYNNATMKNGVRLDWLVMWLL